jgi:Glycoside hydrolase 123, catalytic domain/Glycoside hydrolase 123, N-terminal domain
VCLSFAVQLTIAKNNREIFRSRVQVLLCILFICSVSCTRNRVNIQSYILRDRVIVSDQVLLKKALYVAFSLSKGEKTNGKLSVHGLLLNDDKTVCETFLKAFSGNSGNLVFDLPYEIPDGQYTIKIDAFAGNGELAASGFVRVEKSDLNRVFNPGSKSSLRVFEEVPPPREPEGVKPTSEDKSVGYTLFSRSPLEYIFPESRPQRPEIIDQVAIEAVRNEFKAINFSIYPIRDLGMVKISVTDLRNPKGTISKDHIRVAYVEMVQESIGLPEGRFLNLPTLIRPGNQINIEAGKCQRFWLTIRIDHHVSPGTYKGEITISPQSGSRTSLPFKVTVHPLSLEDVPSIDYFMMMTYEFTELTMPWSDEEKKKIYQSACAILKDYKEHGITTLCFHSPFVLLLKEDGTPNLEDIFAALRAARDVGFKRPIIWYMGHLIQTSKPLHPGNIIGFDKEIHLPRLKYLVERVSQYAKEHGCPEVIFLPIDEPGDATQDYQRRRYTTTPLLLKTIKESGAKNMLTASHDKGFGPVDYLCSGKMNEEDLRAAHRDSSVYWLLNNEVTTRCLNPAYARYIYGYYTWMNHIDGMSSWTFQNTQNASGLPTRADAPGRDIYLAYPDPKGPMATLKWEAIREGINDHKLIHQLEKRIRKLKQEGIKTSKYEDFLQEISKKVGTPGCLKGGDETWSPIFFQKTRDRLISMILDAEAKITRIQKNGLSSEQRLSRGDVMSKFDIPQIVALSSSHQNTRFRLLVAPVHE